MLFNALYPLLEAIGYWCMRLVYRILDGGFNLFDDYSTSTTSIQRYIDIYAGP